jgi:integrase
MANKKIVIAEKFPQDQVEDFPFSQTRIKSIENSKYPVKEEVVFKDTGDEANGLRIRIYPSGKAVYMIEKRIRSAKGGAKKRKIANVSDISLIIARREAGRFIKWMAQGLDPFDELEKEKEKNKVYTLLDGFNLFMEGRGIVQGSVDRYERLRDVMGFVHINKKRSWKTTDDVSLITNLNKFKGNSSNLKSLLDADLNDISSQSIISIHKSITDSHGHGDNKAHTEGDKAIQFIGHIYDLAIKVLNERHDDNNFIKRNPTKIMNHGKGYWNNPGGNARRRREALDTDHIKAHYNAIMSLKTLKNEPDPNKKTMKYTHKPIPGAVRAHYFLRFMFWTGWRPGDTARIEWDQIEEENGMMTVSWDDSEAVEKLKSGEIIYKVPLNHQAIAVIKELREIRNAKLKAAKDGDIPLPKNYNYNYVFLNVFEDNHIKPNQHHYEVAVSEVAGVKHYPTGIYRKTFLSYGEHLNINVYSLKRLVFHTQNYYDVTSGYISTNRERLRDISEEVCSFILSLIDPKQYEFRKKSALLTDTKIDSELYKELHGQFKDKTDHKISDLIRIALAVKALDPALYKKLDSTTTENAEFEDSDFDD